MKTRTLMLLALGCGVLIMLAGAVFLFQLSSQDELDPPVPLGEIARIGDMSVTVDAAEEAAGTLIVTVTMGGVADPAGAEGFRLLASGRPVSVANTMGGDASCSATTIEIEACELLFDVSAADGTSRVLFYERGDSRARWVLG